MILYFQDKFETIFAVDSSTKLNENKLKMKLKDLQRFRAAMKHAVHGS